MMNLKWHRSELRLRCSCLTLVGSCKDKIHLFKEVALWVAEPIYSDRKTILKQSQLLESLQ